MRSSVNRRSIQRHNVKVNISQIGRRFNSQRSPFSSIRAAAPHPAIRLDSFSKVEVVTAYERPPAGFRAPRQRMPREARRLEPHFAHLRPEALRRWSSGRFDAQAGLLRKCTAISTWAEHGKWSSNTMRHSSCVFRRTSVLQYKTDSSLSSRLLNVRNPLLDFEVQSGTKCTMLYRIRPCMRPSVIPHKRHER